MRFRERICDAVAKALEWAMFLIFIYWASFDLFSPESPPIALSVIVFAALACYAFLTHRSPF